MAQFIIPKRQVSAIESLENYPAGFVPPAGLLIAVDSGDGTVITLTGDGTTDVSTLYTNFLAAVSQGVPSGGAEGSLSVKESSVFKVYTDTGRHPGTGVLFHVLGAGKIFNAGVISGTHALGSVAAHVHGTFSSNITIQKPTFDLTGVTGQVRVRYHLSNTGNVPYNVSFDFGGGQFTLNGWKVPVSSIRPNSSAEFEIYTNDSGTTWFVDGWQGGLMEFVGEIDGTLGNNQVIRESLVLEDTYFPYSMTSMASFVAASPGPSANTQLLLRRYRTSWQTACTVTFTAGTYQNPTVALNTVDFTNGLTFQAGDSMQIIVNGAANGLQQLRGAFKCFR